MGEASDRLLCALEGKPCAYTSQQVLRRHPDGRLTVVSGKPSAPLCGACPERDKPPGERRVRHLTIVLNAYAHLQEDR